MSSTLLTLDQFVFAITTLAYQELQRQTQWKHRTTSRVGARDARQFTGQGDDTITVAGWIAPELAGDALSLDRLRDMGDAGRAYALVDGTGNVYGAFVIESINETRTLFYPNGKPRRIEFSISLAHVDDELATPIYLNKFQR